MARGSRRPVLAGNRVYHTDVRDTLGAINFLDELSARGLYIRY